MSQRVPMTWFVVYGWLLLEDSGFDFPIEGEQIGPGQFVLSAREILCECMDNIIRPVVVVHILDSETGQEQMLAIANHQVSPRVRPWQLHQASLVIRRASRSVSLEPKIWSGVCHP